MKTCLDCGNPIINRGRGAVRCLECAEKREKKMAILRVNRRKDRLGKEFCSETRKFKNKAHLLQGDSCIICGFNVPNMPHGGCDVHHIIPLSSGGTNDEDRNAAILCPNCHVEAHQGIISVEKLLTGVLKAKTKRINSKIDASFIDRVRARA